MRFLHLSRSAPAVMTASFVGIPTFQGRHTFTGDVGVKNILSHGDSGAVVDTLCLDDVCADCCNCLDENK